MVYPLLGVFCALIHDNSAEGYAVDDAVDVAADDDSDGGGGIEGEEDELSGTCDPKSTNSNCC